MGPGGGPYIMDPRPHVTREMGPAGDPKNRGGGGGGGGGGGPITLLHRFPDLE